MASSRPVAAGETYTPDDINNLRADVLDPTGGHKHNGTDGARVPFANLDVVGAAGSTPPSGSSRSYNDIASHVASDPGVHGLGSNVYVLGANTGGLLVQGGFISGGRGGYEVYFPVQFTQNGSPVNPLSVVLTAKSAVGDVWAHDMGAIVYEIYPDRFTCDLDSVHDGWVSGAFWMAMGYRT